MIPQIIGIVLGTLSLADIIDYKMKKQDTTITCPPDTVSIIIPALNEEQYIEKCLQSIKNQSIVNQYPEYFEYILVDNGSSDNTVNIAKQYITTILHAPKGKLNARNMGTLHSKNNIIVAIDADIVYPYHWLNTLLKPLHNYDIIGVSGSIIDNNISYIPKPLYIIGSTIDRNIIHPQRMMGGNCAYWKHLFYLSGQFNTTINQQDVKQMVKEEEINFGKKLSNYGKISFQLNAPGMHLGSQKVSCRYGLESQKICNKYKIGIERFG